MVIMDILYAAILKGELWGDSFTYLMTLFLYNM